jgi:hypothetical protein
MKPRHAAALALIGWYLMLPPVDRNNRVLDNLPIGKWDAVDSYDVASDCRDANLDFFRRVKDLPYTNWQRARVLSMQCIATDDPRLKEK